MLLTNCDIGERGTAHPVDDQLMCYIDIANIACGGHAGDETSVDYYRGLAERYAVQVSAHLSYPDRANFGRYQIVISHAELCAALEQQFKLLPVAKVKFHGALYHAANQDADLAAELCQWLVRHEVQQIIAPEVSYLSDFARSAGLEVCYEGFIERGYQLNAQGQLELIPRGQVGAELESLELAYAQYQELCLQRLVVAGREISLRVATACIHSDSKLALSLAQKIHAAQ